ncbi:hypothetical protein HK096_008927, partial [Nowakowskiella sp. JEL0078]
SQLPEVELPCMVSKNGFAYSFGGRYPYRSLYSTAQRLDKIDLTTFSVTSILPLKSITGLYESPYGCTMIKNTFYVLYPSSGSGFFGTYDTSVVGLDISTHTWTAIAPITSQSPTISSTSSGNNSTISSVSLIVPIVFGVVGVILASLNAANVSGNNGNTAVVTVLVVSQNGNKSQPQNVVPPSYSSGPPNVTSNYQNSPPLNYNGNPTESNLDSYPPGYTARLQADAFGLMTLIERSSDAVLEYGDTYTRFTKRGQGVYKQIPSRKLNEILDSLNVPNFSLSPIDRFMLSPSLPLFPKGLLGIAEDYEEDTDVELNTDSLLLIALCHGYEYKQYDPVWKPFLNSVRHQKYTGILSTGEELHSKDLARSCTLERVLWAGSVLDSHSVS